MFPFTSRSKTPETPEPVAPTPASKAAEPHPLDALTGGAFSAATSGERSARIRQWLSTEPSSEQLQEVFKELSGRDKGAARAVRERLDEIRRANVQQTIAAEWATKAEALLAQTKLNIADALAWQRDAAKAGAPLSREPLAQLKTQLAERIKVIEDLQHRVQVQREAAVLLAQRIEVLSTKPLADAQAALDTIRTDVQRWNQEADELTGDAAWASVEARFPPQLESSQTQLQVVWEAFQSALEVAVAAAADTQAPLPPVPVWADELRAARGLPTEAETAAAAAQAKAAATRPKVDPQQREQAEKAVRAALATLEQETAEGHGKASMGAAAALRAVLKEHGRLIDQPLEHQVHSALVAAGELEGWQRWSADQVREDLVTQAQALLQRPEGQTLGGRKMQELLRQLREQWKQADQGAPANHALWKKFDDACNAAYQVVQEWLDKMRAEAAEHRAQRLALIGELNQWAAAQTQAQQDGQSPDWKAVGRSLHQFSDRWRNSGHLSEKAFAELQPQWKQALSAAGAALAAAQKASLERRQTMIAEAQTLGEAPSLRIDAVKALQQRWQAEAQTVPLDRKQEQRLWDAFRKPIDEAFNRKTVQRERAAQALSARDQAVLQASQELEAANASGDAQRIREAMGNLEAVLRGEAPKPAQKSEQNQTETPAQQGLEATQSEAPQADLPADAPVQPLEVAESQEAASESSSEPDADAPSTPAAAEPAKAAPRPVVAVRGDDRPGQQRGTAASAAPSGRGGPAQRGGRTGERGGRFGERGERNERGPRSGNAGAGRFSERAERGPRLGDAAFRAQREALEQAQGALRKLAAQAHGQVLTQLLQAWEQRDASQLPSAQELGSRVNASLRQNWSQTLSASSASAPASEALLRLEMAADQPTPAEHLNARRALQLQLLTRRNDPSPSETWGQDVAQVLAGPSDAAQARRLQNVLKVLLRK